MEKKITVFVPTFNRAHLLRDALTCLKLQTLSKEHFRVVVVDNASSDDTSSVVVEFGELEIIYIRREANIGLCRNWMSAREFFDTPYFHFLSDDDLLAPSHLEYALGKLEAHRDVGVFGTGNLYGTSFWGKDIQRSDLRMGDSYIDKTDQCCHWSREAWLAAHSITSAVAIDASLFRTSVLRQINPLFDSSILQVTDRWFMVQVGAITDCITSPWPSCSLRVLGNNQAHGKFGGDLHRHSCEVAVRTINLAKSLGYDIPNFWRRYNLETGHDRTDIMNIIETTYPEDAAEVALAGWLPRRGRLDSLPLSKSTKKRIRSLKTSLMG